MPYVTIIKDYWPNAGCVKVIKFQMRKLRPWDQSSGELVTKKRPYNLM